MACFRFTDNTTEYLIPQSFPLQPEEMSDRDGDLYTFIVSDIGITDARIKKEYQTFFDVIDKVNEKGFINGFELESNNRKLTCILAYVDCYKQPTGKRYTFEVSQSDATFSDVVEEIKDVHRGRTKGNVKSKKANRKRKVTRKSASV